MQNRRDILDHLGRKDVPCCINIKGTLDSSGTLTFTIACLHDYSNADQIENREDGINRYEFSNKYPNSCCV